MTQNAHDVVIVSATRSPIGKIRGSLSTIRPDDMAATIMKSALERANLEGAELDEIILGCANQAGEDNRNIARMATMLAGLPEEVPAFTGTPPVLSGRLNGSHISQSDTKTNNGIKVSYGAHGPPVHTATSIKAEQT